MEFIHIIVLMCASILLFAVYCIARVHIKEEQLGKQEDFISDFINKKTESLKKEHLSLSIDMYLKIMLTAPLIIGCVFYFGSGNGLVAVISGGLGLLVPEGIIQYMRYDIAVKFEERYARSLEQLSSSLRAGMSISQAVDDVANCKFLHESMRAKYAKLNSDLQMGLSVKEAFSRFAEGTNNPDAEDVAIAIDVQDVVGGHEAEVIQGVAKDIRDRIMLRREVKSLFSSTSSAIWIMDVLGPGVIVWFLFTNKEYMEIYFSNPLYIAVFIFICVMIAAGIFINHRTLAKIRKEI